MNSPTFLRSDPIDVLVNSVANSPHFTCYDGNGNVSALVGAQDGSVTARYEYGPFGEPLRLTGSMAKENPFRFSTKRANDTADLVLYEYRIYTPSVGRWLSSDPVADLGFSGGPPPRPKLPELLAFAVNNPVSNVDLLGLLKFEGCTPDQQADIQYELLGLSMDISAGSQFACCFGKSGTELLIRRMKWENFKVICDPKTGDCGSAGPWWIKLGDPAWKDTKCGNLRCVILHELVHVTGRIGEKRPCTAEKCYGCPNTPYCQKAGVKW